MAPPNLLFLFTDEQRYDTLGAYGNERIETPNLARPAGPQRCAAGADQADDDRKAVPRHCWPWRRAWASPAG